MEQLKTIIATTKDITTGIMKSFTSSSHGGVVLDNYAKLKQILFTAQPLLINLFREVFEQRHGLRWQGQDAIQIILNAPQLKLNQQQKEMIQTKALSEWDVTLLAAVLIFGDLNLNEPQRQAVLSIRDVRNAVSHSAQDRIEDSEYHKYFEALSSAFKTIPGGTEFDLHSLVILPNLVEAPFDHTDMSYSARKIIHKEILSGKYPKHRFIEIHYFCSPQDLEILDMAEEPKWGFRNVDSVSPEIHVRYASELRSLMGIVNSGEDTSEYFRRVVMYYGENGDVLNYCIYHCSRTLSFNLGDVLYNLVSVPRDIYVSDEWVQIEIASCIKTYNGDRNDFNSLNSHLMNSGVDMENYPIEEAEIWKAQEFLRRKCRKMRIVNENMTSYGLKHLAEDWDEYHENVNYVSNSSMKIALLSLGYRIKTVSYQNQNVFSNVFTSARRRGPRIKFP